MIPDDLIDNWLGSVFGHSDPGDTMHHMLFAVAGSGDVNALGLPDPDKLSVTVFALAPVGGDDFDSDAWVAQQIRRAIADARQRDTVPYFAALALEVSAVDTDGNEVTENQVRRMHADLKLHEHPAAYEVTSLYAACRDGRRWKGEHFLTGPNAGKIVGPSMREAGDPTPERTLHQRLIRAAVGLR